MSNKKTAFAKALSLGLIMGMGAFAFNSTAEAEDFTIQLSWLPNASNAGEIIALKKGFFEEAGLDVTILPGGPSANAIQEVLSGTAEVAIGYAPQIMYAVERGLPIMSFGASFQKAPLTFYSLAEKEISSVADWKGQRVGASQSAEPQLKVLLNNVGLALSDITFVQAQVPALLQDQVDVVATWATNVAANQPVLDHPGGYNEQSIWDNGLQFQSNYFITRKDMMSKQSDALKAFVAAADKGWAWVADNQDAAVDLLTEFAPALDKAKEKASLAVIIEDYIYTGETAEHGFGYVSPNRWQETLDRYAALGEIKDSLTAADVHDGSILEAVDRTKRD